MKKIEFLNKFIFQFLFFRLTRCEKRVVASYSLHSFDVMINGNVVGRGVGKVDTYEWYSIQYFIKPFSGWNSQFIFLNKNKKPKFFRVSKKKIKI